MKSTWSSPLLRRYLTPAGHFNEALPVGNGRLGAMVFDQPHRERPCSTRIRVGRAVLVTGSTRMRGAVRFVLDFLVEGPAGSAHTGRLTTCPSHSPENAFLAGDGTAAKFTYGVTMDFGLCRALFAACLEAIDARGDDANGNLRTEIVAAGNRLPSLAISARTGGIQEWAEDHAEADPGHRHVSPLFDLHPGVGISLYHTPALAAAAAATLRHKAANQSEDSDGQPGWTINWVACF